MERKIIVTPNGKEVDVSNLNTDVGEFVKTVYSKITPEFSRTEYGHAAMSLATGAVAWASLGSSPEEQAEHLRKNALNTIQKFGPNIIPLLRDELRLSLTEEDLLIFQNK